MEKANKRGKIPQSDWPLIMARYEAGETLASIARTYDCSPPAISYVVSRSRARQPSAEVPSKATNLPETQLIKIMPGDGSAATEPESSPAQLNAREPAAPVPDSEPLAVARPEATARAGNGRNDDEAAHGAARFGRNGGISGPSNAPPPSSSPGQRPAQPPTNGGDQRRTLHLSLGAPHTTVVPRPGEPPVERPVLGHRDAPMANPIERRTNSGPGEPPPFAPGEPVRAAEPVRYGGGDAAQNREAGSSFIDRELRARVDGDIAAFLGAFDAALARDSLESRAALREATDRLLRAGARTRIELERLEARMPLPARDGGGRSNPAWRDR
jgi:hypothetical protein